MSDILRFEISKFKEKVIWLGPPCCIPYIWQPIPGLSAGTGKAAHRAATFSIDKVVVTRKVPDKEGDNRAS